MSDKTPAAPAAASEEVITEPTVSVFNRGGGAFIHGEYRLEPGQMLTVPKSIADLWMGHGGAHARVVLAKDRGAVETLPDPKIVKENAALRVANAESDARIKALEAELEAAKTAMGGARVPTVPPKPKQKPSDS